MKIQFKGLLKSPVSWAKVNREFLKALRSVPRVSIGCRADRGFLWDESFQLSTSLQSLPEKISSPDLCLMFEFPPNLERYDDLDTQLWNMSVYEASRLPSGWVEPINTYCDRVVVPSSHAHSVYAKSGVNEELLLKVPYGYDPDQFHPSFETGGRSETGDLLKVVTVATPHHRKGLDLIEELSDVIEKAPIRWRVHAPYDPLENSSSPFWEDETVLKRLSKKGFEVTSGSIPDYQVANLYRWADLSVQPSRSEGFGLTILEAMACGLPVITSNWGGHLDFSGEGMILIDGEKRDARNCQYASKNSRSKVFEPDVDELREKLQEFLESSFKCVERGRAARDTVTGWTWADSAERFIQEAQALSRSTGKVKSLNES